MLLNRLFFQAGHSPKQSPLTVIHSSRMSYTDDTGGVGIGQARVLRFEFLENTSRYLLADISFFYCVSGLLSVYLPFLYLGTD